MKVVAAALSLFILAACATDVSEPATAAETRGQTLAEAYCASCHAVGQSGESPAPEAPPFRRLSESYRVSALEEALAEGISVGHPAMPEFRFSPEDVDALVRYLQSIQETEAG